MENKNEENKNPGILEKDKERQKHLEETKKEAEKLVSAINKIFSTEEGELVLRYLAIGCAAFSITADPKSNEVTFFNEGKKKVFMDLWRTLNNETKKKLIDKLY